MKAKAVFFLLIIAILLVVAGYAADRVFINSSGISLLADPSEAIEDNGGASVNASPQNGSETGAQNDTQNNAQADAQGDIRNSNQPQEQDMESAVDQDIEPLKIVAVGDIMFGRSAGKRLSQHAEGYSYAFSRVADLLNEGDIVFGNLEAPLTDSTKSLSREKKIILKAAPEAITGIKTGGFNILSLANNHMMDYYAEGLEDTINILNEHDILFSGGGKNLEEARKPAIITKKGVSLALLSYSDMVTYTYAGNPNISYNAGEDKPGLVPRDYKLIKDDIDSIKGKADLIAISLHWGIEESFKISDDQIEFARQLLDDGADMILGHHPHQFQGIEIYKGKPIFYSMGNFLFDQNDPENMESFIIKMEYEDLKLKSLSAIPVRIKEKSYVERQVGEAAKNILDRQMDLCAKLGTSCRAENDILIFELFSEDS
jgi:poly-gamma-glutamate capsule biosynthesis protein CapA/YwtB (metallophosphatase superfamily)